MTRRPTILILGCFDTKGEIFAFLRECILSHGAEAFTVNVGVMGSTALFPIDIEAEAVCEAAGMQIDDLRSKNDRGFAMQVLAEGATKVIRELKQKNLVHGAIGMGGGSGTYVTLQAMQALPLGFPKLCISTLATKDLSEQIGVKDILMMPSVVDVAALNSIIKPIMQQAAAALVAMCQVSISEESSSSRIAISMFGNTSVCVNYCTELLEAKGYEVMPFHANGVGGKAMESLAREGCFAGILDITTTELADELCGGICSAGAQRLEAAGAISIPQVVVPGCMDMVNFGSVESVPEKYRHRQLYSWVPTVTLMRTNVEENIALGKILSEKLNRSTGPTAVLIPEAGLSQIDAAGNVFADPIANQTLVDSIRKNLNSEIPLINLPLHINDRRFAEIAVEKLLELMA